MKKRIVSLLLALVMMTSLLPVQVFAVDADDAAAEQPVAEQQQEQKQEETQAEAPAQEPEQEAPTKAAEPAQQEQTAQQEPAAQENSGTVGNCSNGYVTDIKFRPVATATTTLPDYTFVQAKTYNEITLYQIGMPAIRLSIDKAKAADGTLGYTFQLDGAWTAPMSPGNPKPIKVKPTRYFDILCALGNLTNDKVTCGTHTLSLQVGVVSADGKSLESGYDEYVFSFRLLPAFDPLTVKEDGKALTITPTYAKGARYFSDSFTAAATGETVTVEGKFYTDGENTKCYIGSSETPLTGTLASGKMIVSAEITLADYLDAASGVSKIPLRLVYEKDGTKLETVTYLYIASAALVSPVITRQPSNISCKKLETPTLSVAATAPAGVTLTYQWYVSKNGAQNTFLPIEGATDSSYTLTKEEDTRLAGGKYYYCDVTGNVTTPNGEALQFVTRSDTVIAEAALSFVSAPTILKNLGTFVSTSTDRFADIYRTEYTAGEKFDLMYISVEKPEKGVTLSMEYFVNTTPDFATAQPLDFTHGQGWEVTTRSELNEDDWDSVDAKANDGKIHTHIIVSAKPVESFAEGSYYIFCKVTASAEGLEPVSSVSMSPKLTFKRIELEGFTGSGTENDPYQITSEADFIKIRDYVYNGQWCAGVYFKMMNDVALSADWEPIGGVNEALTDPTTGRNIQQFSGILDGGGHKLTVAKGGKSLFNYTSDAVIENLDIYGEQINGNGLIDGVYADYGADGNYWTGVPDCVTIRNVRLLEGSSTLLSGFMTGSGSGKNTIRIENCVIQKGVTIGYGKQQSGIGSFVGGMFNGEISNSYSEATVYGKDRVGGLAGVKGQSMGLCQIVNSHFSGQIIATGDWVGGLIAKGYTDDSAPNTMAVSFINSYVDADITGNDYVGGLFGGEGGLKGCMNECWLKDSHFYGTINANGEHVGGIIGYMASINAMQHVENNYFYEKSGKVTKLIGEVVRYGIGFTYGFADEAALEEFKANMGSAKTEKEFQDGTVLALLNEGSDYKNWVQNVKYPTLSPDPVVMGLTVSGEFKTKYEMGEALDLTGIRFKATWSDNTSKWLTLADVKQLDEFDPNHLGQQTITFQYGAGTASITVTVYKTYTDAEKANFGKATVYFSLSRTASSRTAAPPRWQGWRPPSPTSIWRITAWRRTTAMTIRAM